MNKLEFLKLIANAPKRLKGYSELLNYARNAYKQIMGVFPEGIDNISIKQAAKEASENRKKVIEFPKEKITDPFKPRPGEGELSVTIEGQTKNMTPEGIMEFLMKRGTKGTDITGDTFIGKAPKTKKTKPAVDPELQKSEDRKQLFMDSEDRNKTRPDPRVKQPPGAKMDIQRANENIAGGSGYAEGDTKYNADILGEELARMRGFIKEGQDSTDMDPREYSKLYDEAYSYLTQLRRLNRPSPGKGQLSVTIGGETKNMTPEGIMEFMIKRGTKGTDITGDTFIGKAPKTKKTKPAVDPELQAMEDQNKMFQDFSKRTETEAEMLERMKRQNKESVERLKKKKEKDLGDKLKDLPDDIDPDAMADGGRIGFGSGSVGAVGFAGNQTEESQPGDQPMEMPRNLGFQPIMAMPQKNIPGSGGIKELKQFLQAVGAPELGMGYNFPVGQSGILGVGVAPSGNVGAQLKIPLSGGMFGLGKKDGGRINFKNGGKPKDPSRRTFIKGIAGLAALPFVGKLFKPAAKVAKTAGPAIAEGVKLGFDKFMMLVDKIKRLGRKTDDVTQKEREVGYTYQGKDGSEYELVEDLTTGDVRITKDKPGFAMSGDEAFDTIEDRSTFVLRRNQADETTKGKKPPDEYDEMKEVASRDGTFDDIDEVDDSTVKEILEELGETRTKKASGGLAYMLGE